MELLRTLATLAERPTPQHATLGALLDLPGAFAQDTWTDVFLLGWFPYGSVHLGPEGMLGGEARDRVAGFLRTLDATPPAEPDHLPVLLVAYADLAERARKGPEDQSESHVVIRSRSGRGRSGGAMRSVPIWTIPATRPFAISRSHTTLSEKASSSTA